MHANIKWIIIGIFILGCIALFIWGDRIQPGSVFAGLAAFIAAIKSKLFGNDRVTDKISQVQRTHELKRAEWQKEKEKYEELYDTLETRLDTLNTRIERLNEKLESTSKPGYEATKRREEEILRWLKEN